MNKTFEKILITLVYEVNEYCIHFYIFIYKNLMH